MSVVRPFCAVRPEKAFAAEVAALPYDVMNSAEAKQMAEGNPNSFLHVDKAEIDLPAGTDLYAPEVYVKARENLESLFRRGVLQRDEQPCFYLYAQTMNGRTQNGIVACASIDDYLNNVIKKHEFTREDKEQDRIRHVDTCDANTGPIFLTYRRSARLFEITENWKRMHAPVYDFEADGVRQVVHVVDCPETIAEITSVFTGIGALYIADGHHRAASAVRVGQKRRAQKPDYTGEEEFNFFLSVLFPSDELAIMDYNRVVTDLNGLTKEEFFEKISERFVLGAPQKAAIRPSERHTFSMYLDGAWYPLKAKDGTFDENDPVGSLDVSVLQSNLIAPVLGISDPRTDKRIDFVGGIRGLKELERRANSDMRLAFAMYPTSLDELMAIADAGKVMPPKSTWFEPKLLSGLFVHTLG